MQLGMIGLRRMGANMVRRLLRGGHECVVFNKSRKAVDDLVREKATGATDLEDLVKKLATPRAIWLMVPAAAVDQTIADLVPHISAGDIVIDGGNSYYIDDIRRARDLAAKGIRYLDVGTSGGVWGLIKAAIDESVPAPVLSAALYQRFASRGEADYQNRLLSAMRFGFGGHLEKSANQ
jgi:6-phosphogluconate dehydrogenase